MVKAGGEAEVKLKKKVKIEEGKESTQTEVTA